jgi:hypothetical protein
MIHSLRKKHVIIWLFIPIILIAIIIAAYVGSVEINNL